VREALASALDARALLQSARVLDLFAGTGALGLEALSRGAESLVAVESDADAVDCIRANAQALGVQTRMRVLKHSLLGPVAKLTAALARTGLSPFTLVFADPPYAQAEAAAALLQELAQRGLLVPGTVVALEHAVKQPPAMPACCAPLATYAYGDTGIRLWEIIAPSPET
jgi:16S rRNA (guanine966-N2)-methyltransferase